MIAPTRTIAVLGWIRTVAKAAVLAADGAQPACTAAAAAADADVLITMLADGAAVEQVTAGPTGALSVLRPGAIWIQMSTVGVQWCDRLGELADCHGVRYVDAPGPPLVGSWKSLHQQQFRRACLPSRSSTCSDDERCGCRAAVTAVGSSWR